MKKADYQPFFMLIPLNIFMENCVMYINNL